MDRRKFIKDASAVAAATALGGMAGCSRVDPEQHARTVTAPAPATTAPGAHPDLLASYWTIAGDVNPGTGGREWSLFDFRDRVEAAARAGFRGIGLWHADVEHTLESLSLADMKKILDDNGIAHLELEFLQLSGWLNGGDVAAAEADKNKLLTWAEALNARHVKVGDFFNTPTTLAEATAVFAAVCTDAANAGTNVLFEMMPFAMIDDFERSIQMVVDAGADNGGVMMDTWHMLKMGVPMEKIASTPSEYLLGIELNDGWTATPEGLTLVEETVLERQFPGEGEWDMPAFMDACLATGYAGPYGVEVINQENRARSLDELVEKAYRTTVSMFA
jgi:sugar phosphate isomerase/epimerase